MKENLKTQNTSGSSNYQLKSEAVEELVNAKAGDAPEYSQEELNRYRSKSRLHIGPTVKVLFIKAWFAGAVCYFIMWGLGMYVAGLDLLVVLGAVLGMVTDLLTNNVIRFIEKIPEEHNKWLLISRKGTMAFFTNIVYGFVLLTCVFLLYNLINFTITSITGNTDSVALGVEPVLFGVFCMLFDLLFLGIKHLIIKAVDRPRGE